MPLSRTARVLGLGASSGPGRSRLRAGAIKIGGHHRPRRQCQVDASRRRCRVVKLINGWAPGKKIELIIEDDQKNWYRCRQGAQARRRWRCGNHLQHRVSGDPTAQTVSLETKTLSDASQQAETLTTQLDDPDFFQTCPLASIQLATLMAYTKSRGFKEVAIVRDNSSLSQSFADCFARTREGRGKFKVALEGVIPQGAMSAVAKIDRKRAPQRSTRSCRPLALSV